MSWPKKTGLRLLPLVVLVLLAVLPTRIGAVFTGLAQYAMANESAPAEPAAPTDEAATAAVESKADPAPAPPAEDAAAAVPFDPLTLTRAEIDALQQLARRQEELAARENALRDREALLTGTAERIAAQLQELQQDKTEMAALSQGEAGADEAQLKRLVTVYEAMKPEDAARIFEAMDEAVLLDVVERMAERRLAPILARMSVASAQALTVALANLDTETAAAAPIAASPD